MMILVSYIIEKNNCLSYQTSVNDITLLNEFICWHDVCDLELIGHKLRYVNWK